MCSSRRISASFETLDVAQLRKRLKVAPMGKRSLSAVSIPFHSAIIYNYMVFQFHTISCQEYVQIFANLKLSNQLANLRIEKMSNRAILLAFSYIKLI